MHKILFVACTFIFSIPVLASPLVFQTSKAIDDIFTENNVAGTFVVFDVQGFTFTVHDPKRARKRYAPASTFKILNSLIGLTVGAVSNVNEALPYGGKPQPIKSWEKDMGLRDAIKISNVPIYQELARRIGLEQMKHNVIKADYGNNLIGNNVDDFWLKGPLKISALEQTIFLSRLAQTSLPFPKEAQSNVRAIIKLEEGRDWSLYGKTGWTNSIGWWVGWVEKQSRVFSFAVNIDMPDIKDAHKRTDIGVSALHILGLVGDTN